MAQSVTAHTLTGRIAADGERAELEFATEDGPLVVGFPRTEVIKLLSHAAQLNQQPLPQAGVFVPIEAFPLAHFTLSGTEAGDYVLSVQAADGGNYAFVFDRTFTEQLHQAFHAAVEAAPPGATPIP
jgi:hypothetical protein